jgi:hypothetical protein
LTFFRRYHLIDIPTDAVRNIAESGKMDKQDFRIENNYCHQKSVIVLIAYDGRLEMKFFQVFITLDTKTTSYITEMIQGKNTSC